MAEQKCKDKVDQSFESTMEDLAGMWERHCEGIEDHEDGNLYEYGLCFDYVAPGTFDDQREGFWRYQLSTGGPGTEFRIYASLDGEYGVAIYRIEYWYLDWFDGAKVEVTGDDFTFLDDLFTNFFGEVGSFHHAHKEATDE